MILFPSHPSFPRQPDPSFEEEVEAAKAAGFKIGLVDVDSDVYVHANVPALYRGWILKPGGYQDLCTAEPNLIVNLSDYLNSYNFPEWYRQVERHTPKSVFFGGTTNKFLKNGKFNAEDFLFPQDTTLEGAKCKTIAIDYLGNVPLIVKDWSKSRKHEWLDACFIPDPTDLDNLRRVVTNFLNGQGDDLAGGLVFREFVKLKPIGIHPQSKMPLTNEHRFFVFKGQVFYSAPYWNSGFYGTVKWPDKKVIIDLVPHIKSNFFAIDVAEKEDGGWIVVEVNDGGTASVPDGGNIAEFYLKLRELF